MRQRNRKLRKWVYKLHLYIGLTFGLAITLICFSGSAIVYKPELEKLSISQMAFVEPQTEKLPLQLLLNNVKREYPELRINNMVLYGGDNCAYSFRTTSPTEKGRIQIYVNPYTGEVLGVDRYEQKIMQWLYDFHVNLLARKTGVKIVAILGFFLAFIIISGIWILPAGNLFRWRSKASTKVKMFNSHRITGILSSFLLLIIALSGSYFGFKKEYHSFFEWIAPGGDAIVSAPKIEADTATCFISLDTVVSHARNIFKEGTPTLIFFPKDEKSVFSVRMVTKKDYERTGSNHIYIHPFTGEVVKTNLWKDKPMAEKLTRSMYFIHSGTFASHFSRILWAIAGLIVPVLYYTGFYLWIRKIRKKRINVPQKV